jgi:hypothetical protein
MPGRSPRSDAHSLVGVCDDAQHRPNGAVVCDRGNQRAGIPRRCRSPDRNEREAIAPLPPSPASPQWGSVASPSLDIAAGPATISRVGGGSSDSYGGFSLDDAQFSNADPNSDGTTTAGQRA